MTKVMDTHNLSLPNYFTHFSIIYALKVIHVYTSTYVIVSIWCKYLYVLEHLFLF